MKSLVTVCLVLFAAAFLVPKSHANSTYCVSLNFFCDTLEYTQMPIGGASTPMILKDGSWDWQCLGAPYDTNIMGYRRGPTRILATRPVDNTTSPPTPYAATIMFAFLGNPSGTFDLWETTGDPDDGGSTVLLLTSAFTRTPGPCTFLRSKNRNEPRLMDFVKSR